MHWHATRFNALILGPWYHPRKSVNNVCLASRHCNLGISADIKCKVSAMNDALEELIPCNKSNEEYEHRVKEEAGSWESVVATNFEGKALYEAAEASGRDLAAEKASIQLLLRETEANYWDIVDEEFGS